MKVMSLPKAMSIIIFTVTGVGALEAQAQNQSDELEALKARIAKLESAPGSNWMKNLQFSGLFEFEGEIGENYDGDNFSDLDVATVELGLDANINRYVTTHLQFLYEEDGTSFDIDEAVVQFSDSNNPITLTLGQLYLPFGSFETALINDTLALELGETLQTAAVFAYIQDELTLSAYVFDGDVDHPDTIESWGVHIGYGTDQLSGGFDLISSLADSDGVAGWLSEADWLNNTSFDVNRVDSASGVSLYGRLSQDNLVVMAEYLSALSHIEYRDIGIRAKFKPSVFHLEVNYMTPVARQDVTFAFAIQETDDLGGFLPEQRISLGASFELLKSTRLGAELRLDDDYSKSKGGSGSEEQALIVQLSTVF
jgi:hypothetical protein